MKRASSHQEHMDKLKLAVHVENVTVAFGSNPAIIDIDLEVTDGTIMGIIGPNGSGKSTLLRAILGIVPISAGSIHIYSKPINDLKNSQYLSYVPQISKVNWQFPTSVRGLVSMGLYNVKKRQIEDKGMTPKEVIENALIKTELADIYKKSISELTNGERARALMARALVQDVKIFVMDEPLTLADRNSADVINTILKELKDNGKTLIIGHHDVMTIPSFFDKVTLINRRKISTGTLTEVFNNKNVNTVYGDNSIAFNAKAKD